MDHAPARPSRPDLDDLTRSLHSAGTDRRRARRSDRGGTQPRCQDRLARPPARGRRRLQLVHLSDGLPVRSTQSGRILPADQPVRAEGAQPVRPQSDHSTSTSTPTRPGVAVRRGCRRPLSRPPHGVSPSTPREHGLPVVHVVLHGGEPLLLGAAGLRDVLAELRTTITPGAARPADADQRRVLDDELCRLFVEYDVRIGVSFDGDRAANDRHRVFAHGSSSHDHVRRALALLRRPEYRTSYAGILCTSTSATIPTGCTRRCWPRPAPSRPAAAARHLGPPRRSARARAHPVRGLAGAASRRWVDDGRPMSIRMFEALRPGGGGTEAFGLAPADVLVIEADGVGSRWTR